jgi:hypothetical protein
MNKIILLMALLGSQSYAYAGREGGGVSNCVALAPEYVAAVLQVAGVQGEISDAKMIGADGPSRSYEISTQSVLGIQSYEVTLTGSNCQFVNISVK